MDDYNREGHSKYSMKVHTRCGKLTETTYSNSIGNIIYFGLTDILLVVLVKFSKRLLKNISKIKDNGNERCVSTHLKVCGFAAVNI